MTSDELMQSISKYGDLRELVQRENEHGSPQEADKIAEEAAVLYSAIEERISKLRPVMSDKFSS